MNQVFVSNKNLIELWLSFFIFLLCSCSNRKIDQFFEVRIDGVLWQAFPSEEFGRYNLSYKVLSHQLSILAIAKDGSRIEISCHAPNQLQIGNYPSIKNENGIESGIFYFPELKKSKKQMASITYELPIQENTIQITKIDRSNPEHYIIEGTFSAELYALYADNPKRKTKCTFGRFKVIYYIDSYNQEF